MTQLSNWARQSVTESVLIQSLSRWPVVLTNWVQTPVSRKLTMWRCGMSVDWCRVSSIKPVPLLQLRINIIHDPSLQCYHVTPVLQGWGKSAAVPITTPQKVLRRHGKKSTKKRELVRNAKETHLVISCKRRKFNHYAGQCELGVIPSTSSGAWEPQILRGEVVALIVHWT